MNYYLKYIFNDKIFWRGILLIIIIALSIMDLFSYLFRRPGFFNLVIFKTSVIILIPTIFFIALKGTLLKKKIRRIEMSGKLFEEKREREIREIVKIEPEFTTFCYECKYFNDETKGCSRDKLFERVKEINIGKKTYCLYWIKRSSEFY